MNTTVIFRKVAGSCGRESYPPKIRFRRGYPWAATGLWLVLALVASGVVFSSTATAQDAPWQDSPRQQAGTAAQSYPDEELPRRKVALNDDAPPLPTRIEPDAVDSPSNQPAAPKKAKAAGEKAAGEGAPGDGPKSAGATAPASRHPKAVDEGNALGPDGTFGSPDESGDECDFGLNSPGLREMLSKRLWFRGEALLWWVRGGQTPPLLTTSSGTAAQAQAGRLGQPDTTILFGDQELNTGLHAGARMSFGLWLDACEESGLECSYLILGQNTQSYSNSSDGNVVLARPYFDVSTGSATSDKIAFPNFSSGSFSANSTENFEGAEALWRRAIARGADGRMDLLVGYRFQRLTDGLEISDVQNLTLQPGTSISTTDLFHTKNNFNGVELGFAAQSHQNRWSLDTFLKLGIGQTSTQVLINGWTTATANGTSTQYTGGLLALPSNIGTYDSHQFSVMPELGLTLGYDLTARLKATVGYTLLYWSDVARPGDQISLNVDARQLPPPETGTFTQPAFALHTSDFWAQGLNLGLECRF